MKKTVFSAILAFLTIVIISCSSNNDNVDQFEESNIKSDEKKIIRKDRLKIGIIQNDEPIITGNKSDLLRSWNSSLLKFSRIRGNFTEVYIQKHEKDYYLIFKGSKFKSSFYVSKESDGALYAFAGTSCTTSDPDCSQEPLGCIVKYDIQRPGLPGYCTPCSSGGVCTKTVSDFAMISFGDNNVK